MSSVKRFGLAEIKREGMSSVYGHPEFGDWHGLMEEFDDWVHTMVPAIPWYLRPFEKSVWKLMLKTWQQALLENAKHQAKELNG